MYPPTLHRFVLGPFSGAVRIASMPAFIHSFLPSFILSFCLSFCLSVSQLVSQSARHSFVHPSIGRHTRAYHPFFHCKFNAESSQALLFPVHSPLRTFLPSSSLQRVVTTRGTGRIPGLRLSHFLPKNVASWLQWLQWPFIRSPMW